MQRSVVSARDEGQSPSSPISFNTLASHLLKPTPCQFSFLQIIHIPSHC
jgi:hypothetical protein